MLFNNQDQLTEATTIIEEQHQTEQSYPSPNLAPKSLSGLFRTGPKTEELEQQLAVK